ncbi:uncharacterized protein EV420DRAFT_1639611 [Desarmillaria tabescens]|uniref:Uncharacterized protein n=1 Tax=Armillaria tabescens TaxID=1929756 RepID=A0AA39NB61_ARMTA|nr:uncharacterized protein EV420DRAFT_1639611 [Desarmillaria tabescens]KAK0462393.1 hypothetical protein EV420DRAFT_1639611 [Desarmillaria tabescens]
MNESQGILDIQSYYPLLDNHYTISRAPSLMEVAATSTVCTPVPTEIVTDGAKRQDCAPKDETIHSVLYIAIEDIMAYKFSHTVLDKLSGAVYLQPMEGEDDIRAPALSNKLDSVFLPPAFEKLSLQISVISVHERWGFRKYPYVLLRPSAETNRASDATADVDKPHDQLFLGRPIYHDSWYGNGYVVEILYITDKHVVFNAVFISPTVGKGHYKVTMVARAMDFMLPKWKKYEHVWELVKAKLGCKPSLNLIPTHADHDIEYERYTPLVHRYLHAALTPEF